jgi:hypothetical protein
MVARIFAEHGVFWGDVQVQSAGYPTYENQAVKALLKRFYGLPFCHMVSHDAQFLIELAQIVPHDRPWMMKCGIEYYNAFRPWTPFNVFILREVNGVVRSICEKRPGGDPEKALRAVQWRFEMMRAMCSFDGGAWVDTDRVIKGDLSQVKNALEFCGVIEDERKIKKAIK